MVGQAGLEPAMLKAPDLQSGGVTNFPTDPYKCHPETLGTSLTLPIQTHYDGKF